MATKTDHVKLRNGSQRLAEPRPTPAPAPSEDHEAETGTASFGSAYSDPSTNGHYDARKAFEAAHGNPSPRQRAQRGESGLGEHLEASKVDQQALVKKPAPLT